MADHIVEAFTELAPHYERTMDRELRFMWGFGYRDFVNRLVKIATIRENSRILDLATGSAVIPMRISTDVGVPVDIVGLDITPAMLRQGQHALRRAGGRFPISLVCASAMEIPTADKAFDMVVCGLAMHHLDISRTLSEIARVLSEDGQLALGVVGMPALWRTWFGEKVVVGAIRAFYRIMHGGPRAAAETEAVYNLHTAEEWPDILAAAGFSDIRITEVPSRFRWGPTALFVKAHLARP